jgi:hypothetical protein
MWGRKKKLKKTQPQEQDPNALSFPGMEAFGERRCDPPQKAYFSFYH